MEKPTKKNDFSFKFPSLFGFDQSIFCELQADATFRKSKHRTLFCAAAGCAFAY